VTICLVTDRRRRDPLGQARRAVAAGIDIIQVRERDLDAATLAALVGTLLDVTRASTTRVVVNDRLDVALACGADGVHLRSDSLTAAAARQLAPPRFLIGRSVHRVDEAMAAVGADYLIAGTVFPSASKPATEPLLGTDGLRAIARASAVPVLAIGGITPDRIGDVAAAGAAGVAAIGLFAGDEARYDMVDAMRARFDSVKTAP
jgi:thiamine-phosphate diphosphorylase